MYSLKNAILENNSHISACSIVISIIKISVELRRKSFSSYFLNFRKIDLNFLVNVTF